MGWLPDGRISYGDEASGLSVVSVSEGPPFKTGPPQKLIALPAGSVSVDLTPDESKMLAVMPVDRSPVVTLTVVQDWLQMLKAR